jgi:hypothetical protein
MFGVGVEQVTRVMHVLVSTLAVRDGDDVLLALGTCFLLAAVGAGGVAEVGTAGVDVLAAVAGNVWIKHGGVLLQKAQDAGVDVEQPTKQKVTDVDFAANAHMLGAVDVVREFKHWCHS